MDLTNLKDLFTLNKRNVIYWLLVQPILSVGYYQSFKLIKSVLNNTILKTVALPKKGFQIRKAVKEDATLILKFIKELASYEQMEDEVVAKRSDIIDTIFNE